MNNSDLNGAYATVDLSDFDIKDISSLSTKDIPSITIGELDTFDLDSIDLGRYANVAPSTYNYDPYTYSNGVSSVSIAGSGSATSIYTSHSPSITLSPNTYTNASWATAPLTVNSGSQSGITVKGDADIEGSLKVKGVDISEMLSNIQDKLAIYQPAPELEEKWEELRELARKYKALVVDIKEKQQIWDILKK
jgi:hypothetical protein